MNERLGSYPSIYNLGHAAVASLTLTPVIVEEKVDGSQFSFGVFDGEIRCRSKAAQVEPHAPNGMFARAVETVTRLAPQLIEGAVYRCEYLQKPKHNTLAYDRTPEQHLIIFDISPGVESYLSPAAKRAEAVRLGLECVPVLYEGMVADADQLRALLETTSVLGGQKIEGVVLKPANYDLFGADKKVLLAKFVSEAFKEVHRGEWKKSNPTPVDVADSLIISHRTPARWAKAVQHLREAGELENSPRDIGKLVKEIPADVLKEEEAAIKQALFDWAWPRISRGLIAGMPEWYKQQLLESQFAATDSEAA